MKKFRVFTFCFLLGVAGCDSGFDEINTDINRIAQISPGTLLNEIIYGMVSNNLLNHYNINCQLMQVQLDYPSHFGGIQRYQILPTTGNSQWNAAYKWAKNISEMKTSAEINDSGTYLAIANTLNSWVFSNLTDTFGDVPFSEASQAEEGKLQAKYDDQESIYGKLLSDLREANTLYNHGIAMAYGTDILFANNSRLWQKFTNSLRLRLLLRVSNILPGAYDEMLMILNDPVGSPIIENDAEAAVFKVTGVTPNISPWERALDFSTQQSVSEFFVETLNTLDDPRRPIYVGKAHEQGVAIGYKGIPSGYDNGQFNYSPSYMNNQQVVPPMIIPILTYAEVCFIKTELAQKGYLTDGERHFKNGVRSAIQLWTGQIVSDSYFDNNIGKYDGTLERIMLHKYLALYFTDNQQWAEYRRTGYPVLPKTVSMLNEGRVPSRLLYPEVQQIYNPTHYKEAARRMGGDDINSKVWWDVD